MRIHIARKWATRSLFTYCLYVVSITSLSTNALASPGILTSPHSIDSIKTIIKRDPGQKSSSRTKVTRRSRFISKRQKDAKDALESPKKHDGAEVSITLVLAGLSLMSIGHHIDHFLPVLAGLAMLIKQGISFVISISD